MIPLTAVLPYRQVFVPDPVELPVCVTSMVEKPRAEVAATRTVVLVVKLRAGVAS